MTIKVSSLTFFGGLWLLGGESQKLGLLFWRRRGANLGRIPETGFLGETRFLSCNVHLESTD